MMDMTDPESMELDAFYSDQLTPKSPSTTIIEKTKDLEFSLGFKLLFLISGCFTTLIAQKMFYDGTADGHSLLTITAGYLGMFSVGIFIQEPTLPNPIHFNPLLKLSLIDMVGYVLITVGQFLAGSSLFQLVTSLLIPFTAFLSNRMLSRPIQFLQRWGILAIVVGLGFNALATHLTSQIELNQIQTQGALLTSLGIFLYAISYVTTEKLLNQSEPPTPTLICKTIGKYGFAMTLIYHLIYTLPVQHIPIYTLFLDSLPSNPNPQSQLYAQSYLSHIIGGFILLTISSLVHNFSYFKLVSQSGALSTGILQALRTIGVIFLSGFLFCGADPNQCLSPPKITSAFIVVLGVFIFHLH